MCVNDESFVCAGKSFVCASLNFVNKFLLSMGDAISSHLHLVVKTLVCLPFWIAKKRQLKKQQQQAAATMIQSGWQCCCARKQLKRHQQQQAATTMIQSGWRCSCARKQLKQHQQQQAAATMIQSGWRCCCARKQLKQHQQQQAAATMIQSGWRCCCAQKQLKQHQQQQQQQQQWEDKWNDLMKNHKLTTSFAELCFLSSRKTYRPRSKILNQSLTSTQQEGRMIKYISSRLIVGGDVATGVVMEDETETTTTTTSTKEAEVEEEEKCVGIDDNIVGIVAWVTGAEDGVEEGEGDGDSHNDGCGNMQDTENVEEGVLIDDSACDDNGCQSVGGGVDVGVFGGGGNSLFPPQPNPPAKPSLRPLATCKSQVKLRRSARLQQGGNDNVLGSLFDKLVWSKKARMEVKVRRSARLQKQLR